MNLQQLKDAASKKIDIVKQYQWSKELGNELEQINNDLTILGKGYTIKHISNVTIEGKEKSWVVLQVVYTCK